MNTAKRFRGARARRLTVALVGAAVMSSTPAAPDTPASLAAMPPDGRGAFSFIHGRWLVHNRRLKEPLSAREEWTEFEALLVCVPVLNGIGNVDEMRHLDGRLIGSALRTYDIADRVWSDYWITAREGVLTPPLRGTFEAGGGVFQGQENHRGQTVLVRYVWSEIATGRPRWEQAYSADQGRSWQVNWIMTYERLPEPGVLPWPTDWKLRDRRRSSASGPQPDAPVAQPTVAEGFSFLYGRWRVHNRRLREPLSGREQWTEFEATSACVPLLEGLANVDELREVDGTPMGIALRTFDVARRRWSIYWVAGRDGLLQPPVHGRFEGDVGTFTGPDSYNGAPVQVRYTWSRDSVHRARWEQAFSRDGGRTWETNWSMRFERASDHAALPWSVQAGSSPR